MAEQLIKLESFRNGIFLGLALGAMVLWGDKIREPLVNFLNGIQPTSLGFLGEWWAPIIVLLICGITGYIIDRT